MRSQYFPKFLYISFVFLSLIACVDKHERQNKEKRYIFIDGRDTTRIRIEPRPAQGPNPHYAKKLQSYD